MGCQCAKSNLAQDQNELVKQSFLVSNHEVIKSNNIPSKQTSNNTGENNIKMNLEESVNVSRAKISTSGKKEIDYSERVFELINQIRKNPKQYAETIQDSLQNIIREKEKDKATGEETGKTKIIYKKKVKVALTRGEPAFLEAIDTLNRMEPLPPLEFKKEIKIPLPEADFQIKDSNFLKEMVSEVEKHDKIDLFFKDLVKDPDVSTLLMIVDDNGKNAGKKREAVLSKNFKYIGISHKFIGKSFVAYFAFSS